jgi:hypothetical protein
MKWWHPVKIKSNSFGRRLLKIVEEQNEGILFLR